MRLRISKTLACVALFLTFVARCASAQVTFNVASLTDFDFSPPTQLAVTATVAAGSNRAALIGLAMLANTATSISACVGCASGCSGGTAATLVTGTDSGSTIASGRALLFSVVNPGTGSQTFRACWTTAVSAALGVIVANGVDQATPVTGGTFVATASAPASSSITVTSTSGDLTSSLGVDTGNVWLSPYTNQTLRYGPGTGTNVGGDTGPGTGTTTHTWTDSFSGQDHIVTGANFKAAAAAGGCTPTMLLLGVGRCG